MATNRITSNQGPSPYASFYLDVDIAQTDTVNRGWYLRAFLRMSKGSSSNYGGSGFQSVRGPGGEVNRYSRSPFLPSGLTGWNQGPYEWWVWSDSDGFWVGSNASLPASQRETYPLGMQLSYGNVQTTPQGSIQLPRFATVPPAPKPVGVTNVTQTSARYSFQSQGLGGGTFLRWEAQWSTSPSFTSGNGPIVPSSGTTDFNDLPPGTTVYFRSRGVNTLGNGAWSTVISATTLPSGVQVGTGTAFQMAPMSVGTATPFGPVEILIGKGGSFVPLG